MNVNARAIVRILPRPPSTPHREPGVPAAARPFLDQIAEMLAAAVLRDLLHRQLRPPNHQQIWARAANRMHAR